MEFDEHGRIKQATENEFRRHVAKKIHPDKFSDPVLKQLADEIVRDFNEWLDRHKGETMVWRKP